VETEIKVGIKKKILEQLRSKPLYHIKKIQGVKTTEPYQEHIIDTVAKNERVVISASHAIGKTWTMSKIILWFASTFTGAKVITTAPTFNQVKRLLWSEIRHGYAKSKFPLGGEMLSTEWKLGENWFAVGFTSRNEKSEGEGQGQASSFQGFHSKWILVIFDEATGIPSSIWKQVEGLLTSGFVRFVAIGNPTSKSCEFYKCFQNPIYKKIRLSCFNSPNFIAAGLNSKQDLEAELRTLEELSEDDRLKRLDSYPIVNEHFLTVKWTMSMILHWGMAHPLVVSKCFGEFPDEDDSTLIPLSIVEAARIREYKIKSNDVISIGVDVARFGSDKSVLTMMQGPKVTLRKVLVKRDNVEIAGEVVKLVNSLEGKTIRIIIDGTGIGSGVVDILKEKRNEEVISPHITIREIHFGGAPGEDEETKKQFVNMKAKLFVDLARDLKDEIVLLDDEVYSEELPTIRYRYDSKGRWLIESKDDYKKRTGRGSPDSADSLALANSGRFNLGVGDFTDTLVENSVIPNMIRNFEDQTLW
jgi:hypothetical protein